MSKFKALSWVGSKSRLIGELLPIFEWISVYKGASTFVDVCTGGGTVTCNVTSNRVFEDYIMNDIDKSMTALYSCLQSRSKTAQLITSIDHLVETRESTRALFETSLACIKDDEESDEVTLASHSVISIYGSVLTGRSSFNSSGFRDAFLDDEKKVHHDLHRFNAKLQGVTITNDDLFDIIEKYRDNPKVLLYMDVPYHPDAMQSDAHYGEFSWSKENHQKLAEILSDNSIKCKWVLSGWMNDDYGAITHEGDAWFYKIKYLQFKERSELEYIWTNVALPSHVLPKVKPLKNDGNELETQNEEAEFIEESEEYDDEAE